MKAVLRFVRHLCATHWGTRRRFDARVLAAIEEATAETESRHGGEIRFAIETALEPAELWRGMTPRQRALEVFSQLGVWDTADNNGVLIYVLLADRDVEIVADRGVAARVTPAEWESVCRAMEDAFRRDDFAAGSVAGIRAAGDLLARHFPGKGARRDELPNQPALL